MAADPPPLEKFVGFSPPLIGESEIAEVVTTLRSGWLTTGPRTEAFEEAFQRRVGAGRALAVSSGTAALHLALAGLGIGPGDGVITSPFTFASTGHVILYQRARPFFVDVEPDTFNMDPEAVRRFLEEHCRPGPDGHPVHRETGAVIRCLLPVHYGGHPCRMDALAALAAEHGLAVVEDAAHAVGAEYRGRPVGGLGHLACFSFYATKNVATGEGGMIATDDRDLAARMRILSMYGISDARRIWQRYAPKGSWVYDVAELGFKYNMMDLAAALGLHQLARLDEFLARRDENAAAYDRILAPTGLARTPVVQPGVRHARHLYPVLLETERLNIDRDGFIEALKEKNVGTSVLFIPLHLHSLYQRLLPYREGDFPVAEDVFRRIVNLPVSPAHSLETIERVAETVAGLLERHR